MTREQYEEAYWECEEVLDQEDERVHDKLTKALNMLLTYGGCDLESGRILAKFAIVGIAQFGFEKEAEPAEAAATASA